MRYALLTLTAIIPLATAVPAQADDINWDGARNESPIRGKGAISVVHNEPAARIKASPTTDAVNTALALQGRPQLGTSKLLHDDGAVRPGETRETIRIQSNVPVGYSFR